MEKIDCFAHVLLPAYYEKMLEIEPSIPKKYPFVNIPSIQDMSIRRQYWNGKTKQIISYANINPEDYCDPNESIEMCRFANSELIACIKENRDMFPFGIGMVPMNNIQGALQILDEIKDSDELVGIQLFTRHLGKTIADSLFLPVLRRCAELGLIVLLHPVFDERKPDNHLLFSWEYELSQAMMQLVQADIFHQCPGIKIVVHHTGGMIPFFAGRIKYITPDLNEEFKKFYVDTAILGNEKALELAIAYFGIDHVLYGTDAPFAIMPIGAVDVIENAIEDLPVDHKDKEKIFSKNLYRILGENS